MPARAYRQTATYRDFLSKRATITFHIGTDADKQQDVNAARQGASAIVAAINDLTNARFQGAIGLFTTPQNPYVFGDQALFGNIEDKAVMSFKSEHGSSHRFAIPAPKASIFGPDGTTVIRSHPAVQAFIQAVTTHGYAPSGSCLTTFVSGWRSRRHRKQVYNMMVESRRELLQQQQSISSPSEDGDDA